ncbi:uncharacterized protein LDX57_006849 [Aspergillus melleus]|uniref:uncharacterized protein n=1 Tax=Aspergillus melleus TaxID=138277 RepID=UPI001E8E85F2|nr:uncharacterized protein LDX57_006849 [Aspergillus melleus]KAH8429180.1 hypothetical protein LDX57_006849 [Aspergillus melleus]
MTPDNVPDWNLWWGNYVPSMAVIVCRQELQCFLLLIAGGPSTFTSMILVKN